MSPASGSVVVSVPTAVPAGSFSGTLEFDSDTSVGAEPEGGGGAGGAGGAGGGAGPAGPVGPAAREEEPATEASPEQALPGG